MKVIDEVYNKNNEVGIVREYISGLTIEQVAKKYHTSKYTISDIVKKYGVNGLNKGTKRVKKEDTLESKIIKMYQEDRMTIVDIGKSIGMSRSKVRSVLENANVKINPGGPGKLNAEAIVKMYEAGISRKKIAEILEVTAPAIYNYIRTNKTEEEKKAEELKKRGERKHIGIKEGDVIVLKVKRENKDFEKRVVVENANEKYIVCKHPEGYKETLTKTDLMIGFTKRKIQLATC